MDAFFGQLVQLPIFNQISAAELAHMLKCIGGFVKDYEAGSYIILDGGQVDCVGVVMSGTVHMIKEDVWGEKTILAVIATAQVFGETYVFGDAKSNVSFLATESTKVLFLPFNRVLHTCPKSCAYHQRLVDNMVSLIAYKNLQLTEKLEITTKRSLRAKILAYLSQEAQKNNSKYFNIPLGRNDMADYLCVNRSALTRELTKMKEEGILDYNSNTFRLAPPKQAQPQNIK